MDDLSDPLGIVLVVAGVFVAIKAARAVVKLAMVAVVLVGAYLWFGAGF